MNRPSQKLTNNDQSKITLSSQSEQVIEFRLTSYSVEDFVEPKDQVACGQCTYFENSQGFGFVDELGICNHPTKFDGRNPRLHANTQRLAKIAVECCGIELAPAVCEHIDFID
jgi:hypothetical protein